MREGGSWVGGAGIVRRSGTVCGKLRVGMVMALWRYAMRQPETACCNALLNHRWATTPAAR